MGQHIELIPKSAARKKKKSTAIRCTSVHVNCISVNGEVTS